MSAVLDTHSTLWYLQNSNELSSRARDVIEASVRNARAVHISVISLIETIYLVERNRIPAAALRRLQEALADPGAGLTISPVDAHVATALEKVPRSIVPDMPDRIIAATAIHLDLPLITRDRRLRLAGIQTIW
ncbi:MAG TPA: type II toxin-antitoxin system VapC family toxin [Verrucomicrobiae bacterium]|jgi:PIN domain nuclease of toxin-antitoxin system|nr:type II toxin-antitoxin system VapC family toxin [Verrucomicrobiae bacterium]